MLSVRQIAQDIVAREGGYVNDPDDPGGATNHGVTLVTLKRLGLDVTGDGVVSVEDVKSLTADQAVDIFLTHYFAAPRIGSLPEILQASVFDMYVNAGSNAVRLLQILLRDMGFDLAVDAQIGPQTIKAAQAAYRLAPAHLADAYGIARRNYYYRLADQRAASRKYVRRRDGGKGGWITRAEAFISPRFHLTAREHQQRMAKWG